MPDNSLVIDLEYSNWSGGLVVALIMTILYALVARKRAVLAEHTSSSGNFCTVTRVLLGKIPDQDGKMSYVYDQHVFHYIVRRADVACMRHLIIQRPCLRIDF